MLAQSEKDAALEKLRRYCIYQDRCQDEVRTKLIRLKVYGDDLEEIIAALVQEDFVNEERFAQSYARGKHKILLWGRNRIYQELRRRHISEYCIKKGMKEIEEEQYIKNIQKLIVRYKQQYVRLTGYDQRQKIFQRLVYKGYEMDVINSYLNAKD